MFCDKLLVLYIFQRERSTDFFVTMKGRIMAFYQSKQLPGDLLCFSIWKKRMFLRMKLIVITCQRNGWVAVQKYWVPVELILH